CGGGTTDKNDLTIIRADYPATMVATTRGDDLMVANAVRGNEAYCKNTNGARRHVFRVLHLPTAACSTCSPCPTMCNPRRISRTCEEPPPYKPDNGSAERVVGWIRREWSTM